MSTDLHLGMFAEWRSRNFLAKRLRRLFRLKAPIYGLEWGDPEIVPPLQYIRDQYVLPYIDRNHVAVEIGPGGGRWTRYLLGFGKVIAVDLYSDVLDHLRNNFGSKRNLVFIRNNGSDFPGIEQGTVDFAFSFGTFVHLDVETITSYLQGLRAIMKQSGNIVVQYSDKTKVMAQLNEGFSDNDPVRMRAAVRAAGFRIIEEDTTSLWHSSVMRFTPDSEDQGR